ncbi:MAG: PaaI family thioesterase [Tistrella sp.]|jgi:uncharacterized protein (TIGR00369 family)|uniref:Thioesterase superfamily protein n=2 Tax=Tistrella mobilis TaxID=171437 RepID=I3TGT6_TISMK|nr:MULTISPECIES: PaaI family thioesterase [Tistrella]AFK51974.1 thioesterase superfamily protein [Tistrella mobilis KA081020-065]KYO49447.1 hypothetical protein AUP44_17425 [Tistrella mobilis]MAD38552.1 PaaI family thioesterase [Tistrella sp.]MAM76788.1 PaaI family thioesterase [Tistrella sp.]MBA76831.1 PaaI family thioesterase [Tistrella sp.]|tara:strand:+ start:467 stop:901 length:435 start_codon:yes stop_codon:yes gene_type:complete
MTSLQDAIERSRATGDFTPLNQAVPYARFLNLTANLVEDELVFRMGYRPEHIGNPVLRALHGGIIGSLLETAALSHVTWEMSQVRVPKTITITIDYLRSGRAVDTYATSRITKMGRRVVNVHTTAWQEDRARPIASAIAHFLID